MRYRVQARASVVALVASMCLGTPLARAAASCGDSETVFAASYNTELKRSEIIPIDTATNKAATPLSLEGQRGTLDGFAARPDGSRLYVSFWGKDVVSVDPATGAVTKLNAPRTTPMSRMVISPDGGRLYRLANSSVKVSSTVDGSNSVLRTPIALVSRVAPSPDGSRLYVISSSRHAFGAMATDSGTAIRSDVIGGAPTGLAVSPDGKWVYISDHTNGKVIRIDTGTWQTAEVTVGRNPTSVAVSPDGSQLYVMRPEPPAQIAVLDIPSMTNVRTLVRDTYGPLVVTSNGACVYTGVNGSVSAVSTNDGSVTPVVKVSRFSGLAIGHTPSQRAGAR